MSENKFEAAARLLKALRKVDERHRARVVKSETKCAAERGELLEAAGLDVRNMVLAEGGK